MNDATILRCRAANAASLAGCYAQEAERYAQEAQAADPHHKWRLSDPSSAHPGNNVGLPDDWMSVAEIPLSTEVPCPARRALRRPRAERAAERGGKE